MLLTLLLLIQDPAPAPAPQQGEPARGAEVLVTAPGFGQNPLEAPYSTSEIGFRELRAQFRTVPEALSRQPGVMVQKTAYGQSSPYIRGFTGFRNLLLVDGVRLNHSVFRDGPNQYWSTIDPLTVERIELVRGPSSVLYGSDAIGGTVNAVLRRPDLGTEADGFRVDGGSYVRGASAEESITGRVEGMMGQGGNWAVFGGASGALFGDLEAGSGLLPETGYSQGSGDLRWEQALSQNVRLSFLAQTMRMNDVPRTHTTIDAVPYAGTTVGSELQRDHDQIRDLLYGRLSWDDLGGWTDSGEVTVSYHRHDETRDRLRSESSPGSGLRRDIQGFTVDDVGFLARFRSEEGSTGIWSWGFEAHHESVDSFRDSYVGGSFSGSAVQGPVADDSSYVSAAAYIQNELFLHDQFVLVPGLRFSWFDLDAGSVANPNPGPAAISVSDDWTALTGSLRGTWFASNEQSVWGGLSQGFRAPNLYDLTSLETTSVVETPSPDLDPEHFLQAEIGWKGDSGRWSWQNSAYMTWIEDMIIRSPTGNLIGGVPEVRKDNIGDGWVRGLEAELEYEVVDNWSLFASGFIMDGEVDQYDAGQNLVRAPLTRLAPVQGVTGVRWQADGPRAPWLEAWAWAVDQQDELSFRDQSDTQRIPPGGTPGYTIFGVAAGLDLNERTTVSLAVENIGDKDYRVHGSGVNGPGVNVVLVVDMLL